jgi:HK97 family phage major capsid protein
MEIKELQGQLTALQTELKGYFAKAEEEKKSYGTITEELKSKIDALQKQTDGIDKLLAEKSNTGTKEVSLEESLSQDEGLKRLLRDKSGSHVLNLTGKQVHQLMERKTAIESSAVGSATTGVLQIDRTPGIVLEARQNLTIRSLLSSRPTTMQTLDFVKVNSPLTTASPQIETHTKKENAVTFTTDSEKVRTLATWIPASRQILDDFGELMGFLQTGLAYYVDLAEEQQLLTGSGAGEDLNGLITQATSFNTALLPASGSYTPLDYILRAQQQIAVAKELGATFIVLHPTNFYNLLAQKDTQGRYLIGNPGSAPGVNNLWGLTPVVTTSIASGTFLVGSGSPAAAEIRDRMGMQVEISTQHSTYFTENMIAIRAEKRLALVVYRPGSYITGTLTTSPA